MAVDGGLYQAILAGFRAEAEHYLGAGMPLWPTRSGCLSVLHFVLNNLLCGAWLPPELPARPHPYYVRIGNSCSDEARVLPLLRSHKHAWVDWLGALECNLLIHHWHVDTQLPPGSSPSPMDQLSCSEFVQTPRDCVVGTIYALCHESVVGLILKDHAEHTLRSLGRMLTQIWDEWDESVDPLSAIEGHTSCLLALFME